MSAGLLDDVLTLSEAANQSKAFGLTLHERHDLLEVCRRGLVPAEKRAGIWLMTKSAVHSLVQRLKGLSIRERRASYDRGEVLVDPNVEGATLPPNLLVGFAEIASFAREDLGWAPTPDTLVNYTRRFAHRKAGRTILSTHESIRILFQDVWRNKLRIVGLPQSGGGNAAKALVRLAQILLAETPGESITEETIRILEQAVQVASQQRQKESSSKLD